MSHLTMIPDRKTCFNILRKYNFPQRKRRHVEKVATVAIFLGKRLKVTHSASSGQEGKKLNLDLICAGALLHDIDKGMIKEGDVHTVRGEKILLSEGLPEIARICISHRVDAFLDPKTRPVSWEEKCVALADKMATTKMMTVDERFKLWLAEDLSLEQREIFKKTYLLVKELEKEILGIIQMTANEVVNALI